MRSLAVGALVALATVHVSSARAQDNSCDPTKFTIRDYERLAFSESLQLAVIDILDAGNEENRNSKFDLAAVVKGVPIKVGFDDAKRVSSYVQSNNSTNFSRDQKIDWFRSNPSLVGERMYMACLKALSEEFSVDIPDSAYKGGDFLLTVKWHSTEALKEGETTGTAAIQVLNGTADGKDFASKPILDKNISTFVIKRDKENPGLDLQIVPSVNGVGLRGDVQSIVIPPPLDVKLTGVTRKWPDPERGLASFPLPVIRGDAGSPYGNTPWTAVECITADKGMLVPSTLAIVHSGSVYPAPVRVTDPNRDEANSVCVKFGVYGENTFGKRGSSTLSSASFTVVEIYPEE